MLASESKTDGLRGYAADESRSRNLSGIVFYKYLMREKLY